MVAKEQPACPLRQGYGETGFARRYMPAKTPNALLHGTLDALILKTLAGGPRHGYAIAKFIEDASDETVIVEEGSLYPALYRMERRGWLEAEWGDQSLASVRGWRVANLVGSVRVEVTEMTERTDQHGETEQRRFLFKDVFSVSPLLRVTPLPPRSPWSRMGTLA